MNFTTTKVNYAKGEGKSEFISGLIDNHGAATYIPLERAQGGGRQDLNFDGAVPIYPNRNFFFNFLKTLVLQLDHSKISEDFLRTTLRCTEIIACTLIDLLISKLVRWLAGKATQLKSWSPLKTGCVRPAQDEGHCRRRC
eukprot:4987586-Pleurochrysis_carterae.AAC.1